MPHRAVAHARTYERRRRPGVGLLAVLTALLVVAATLVVWTQRTALDTERFVDVAGTRLGDPVLTRPLAQAAADQALRAAGQDAVPAEVRVQVEQAVEGVVASDAFRSRIEQLVVTAHAGAVGVARGQAERHPDVALTSEGFVVDTRPVAVEMLDGVAAGLGDAGAAIAERGVPDGAGQVPLLSSRAFSVVERAVQTVDRAVVPLVAGAAVALALTLALAVRRRRALAGVGAATAVVAALAALATVAVRVLLGTGSGPAEARAVGALLEPLVADLTGTLWLVAGVGVVLGVVAGLAARVGQR
ncbi:hypothetical protein [Isoptericola variabilis]|uniref:Integral membrane protein n=1 Tax=Isoptericola variabilis (strain 225) TaxID=743718 RepID=F6FTE3_ISOV2|nr:hypothetical protein [Isoptericola variabilis]AEG45307.1 hypothetical protein Isova_2604 [Isoptericola variabilis 225]TWH34810.1 hypothetical protein L600_001000000380 [Isoptericola variabilis J7]